MIASDSTFVFILAASPKNVLGVGGELVPGFVPFTICVGSIDPNTKYVCMVEEEVGKEVKKDNVAEEAKVEVDVESKGEDEDENIEIDFDDWIVVTQVSGKDPLYG